MWLETDAEGRDVLALERPRGRFEIWMDRANPRIIPGCGLIGLAAFADTVAVPACQGRPPGLLAGLLLALVTAVPGAAMTLPAIRGWRHAVPATETDRHVLDADALEMIADMPDDAPVERLLRENGTAFA